MAPIPMTFNVKMPWDELYHHSLRKEWHKIAYGVKVDFRIYLKQQYNIHILSDEWNDRCTTTYAHVTFHSEQDYILWQLHQ